MKIESMNLEVVFSERISRCENCGRITLDPVIIEGHVFCSNICYSEWAWKRNQGRQHSPSSQLEGI